MLSVKRTSVKDIADKLNISLATVHKALSGKPGVSEARRKQVIDTARAMGYVANSAAQSLARKDVTLGVLMPSRWQEYFSDIRSGILNKVGSMQGHCKISCIFYYLSSEKDGPAISKWAKDNQINAIIFCPSLHAINHSVISELRQLHLPIFYAGGYMEEAGGIAEITTDSELSGKLAADFLKCTCHGVINAAVFTGSLRVRAHRIKAEAFRKRIETCGGCVHEVVETHDDPELASRSIAELLTAHPEINGIYVSTSTSEPICRYIEEHGVHGITLIGTDVFDALKEYIKKGVMQAVISQNQEQVGMNAVSCAYEYLTNHISYSGEACEKHMLIRPSLLLCADIE